MRKAIVLFILILCVACGQKGKVPGNVIPMGKMRDVLLDLNLAESYGRNLSGDQIRRDTGRVADSLREIKVKTLYTQVLQLHGITVDEFMESYHYYEDHADRMEIVYKMMNDTIQAHQAISEQLRRAKEKQPPIWEKMYPHSYRPRIPFLRNAPGVF